MLFFYEGDQHLRGGSLRLWQVVLEGCGAEPVLLHPNHRPGSLQPPHNMWTQSQVLLFSSIFVDFYSIVGSFKIQLPHNMWTQSQGFSSIFLDFLST